MRQRSKCAEAGCQEGDALIGINGYSTQGMGHSTAMGLIDSAGNNLTLHVIRGQVDNNAINAAVQELGSALRPLDASGMPQQRGPGGSTAFSGAPQVIPAQGTPQAGENATVTWQDGGVKNPGRRPPGGVAMPGITGAPVPGMASPARANFHRQEQTYRDGNATSRVTTESHTENVGGNMVTKTRRQITTTIGGNDAPAPPPGPPDVRPSMIAPYSNTGVGGAPKPGVWAPGGGGGGGMTVSAPKGIQHNADRSVTMQLMSSGFAARDDGKENVAPQPQPSPPKQQPVSAPKQASAPMFSVRKVSGNQQPSGAWNPGGGSAPTAPKKFAAAPAPAPEPEPEPHHQSIPWSASESGWTPKSQYAQPPPQQDSFLSGAPIWAAKIEVEEDRSLRHPLGTGNIPPHLAKILQPPMDSDDSLPSSPGHFRKKKIYADSSFYADPQKKYPTIEEQIKMARRVALSLTAPQNKRARGHTMFVKQVEKSERWNTDHPDGIPYFETESGEKYYNPNPWKTAGVSWKAPADMDGGYGGYGGYASPSNGAGSYSPVRQASPPRKPKFQPGRAASPNKFQPRAASPNKAAQPYVPPHQSYTPSATKPQPTAPSSAYNPPDMSTSLPTRPLWERLGMDVNPGSEPMSVAQPAYEPPPAAPAPPPAGFIPDAPPPPPVASFPPIQKFTRKKKDDNTMSAEELERVRLFEPKATHNTVSPQVAFSLADDLKNMKGKGGRLFAKRRQKAQEGAFEPESKPNEAVMVKLQLQH